MKLQKMILNKEFKRFLGFLVLPSLDKNIVLSDNEMEFLIDKIKTNLLDCLKYLLIVFLT